MGEPSGPVFNNESILTNHIEEHEGPNYSLTGENTDVEVEAAATLTLTQRKAKCSRDQHCYKKTALPEEEKDLYYRLMVPLRFYVGQKLKIHFISGLEPTVEDFKEKLSMTEKFLIRDAVWDNLHLVDDFIQTNPFNFTNEYLAIVESWRESFVKGTYIVERHLQKGSIFIAHEKHEEEKVFLVHGLETPLVEMLPKHMLPIVIKTVLIPFRGKIIYDGLFKETPTSLSTNISKSLKESYMRAKQQDSIITVLNPEESEEARKKRKRKKRDEEDEVDLKKLAMEISTTAQQLKKAAPRGIESSVCSVLCVASQLVTKVLENPKDKTHVAKYVRSLTTSLNRL